MPHMISKEQFQQEIDLIIQNAIREDVGDGDHSSLACIPPSAEGKAKQDLRTVETELGGSNRRSEGVV